MSVVSDIQAAYVALDDAIDSLCEKSQQLLDMTESMSDDEGQLLVSVRDDMVEVTVKIDAMIKKIDARLTS